MIGDDERPGVAVDAVQDATGWELRVAERLHITPDATPAELDALRELLSR